MMAEQIEMGQYDETMNITCGVCDKIFEDENQLNEHFREHDVGGTEEKYNRELSENNTNNSIDKEVSNIDNNQDINYDPLQVEKTEILVDPYLYRAIIPKSGDDQTLDILDEMFSDKREERLKKARERQRRNRIKKKQERENVTEVVKEENDWTMAVKLEPQDERPKQKYNKLKQFEDTLFRREGSKWECLGCSSTYDSNHGLYYHLKTTNCGFGDKNRSKPKAKWNQYYTKQNELFRCLACDKHYETIRGMHYHLSKTSISCAREGTGDGEYLEGSEQGGGDTNQDAFVKPVAGPKLNWSRYYTRQDDLFTCLNCAKVYESVNGMHYHLKNSTPCTSCWDEVSKEVGEDGRRDAILGGVQEVMPSSSYRRDYRHLYHKGDEGELECLGCGVQYGSIHGLHCHLNNTSCGFGDKLSKGKVKTSYTGLYRKESDSEYICLACSTSYSSMHGLHYHLNRTRCGYGEQERCQPKRNYKGLYSRTEDNLYCCLGPGCGKTISYLTGIHRHLRECPAAGMIGIMNLEDMVKSEPEEYTEDIVNDE